MTRSLSINPEQIATRILVIRRRKVMIDADLAELYGVPTKRLNEQGRRNSDRFADFFFQLSAAERSGVVANCDHLAKLKFSPTLPYAFTEQGALMAASVLNTARRRDLRAPPANRGGHRCAGSAEYTSHAAG